MPSEEHVPSYTILVDGAAIEQEIADRVREIKVEDSLGLPNVCTLKMGFPRPKKETDPHEIDSQPFAIASTLTVKLGARESQSTTTLFEGEVLTLEPEFGSGGVQLLVRAYDKTHRMHRSRVTKSYQDQKSSDIINQVLQRNGLSGSCEDTGGPHKFIQQTNETDWDFCNRLADRVGFELFVQGNEVKLQKPGKGDVVELEWSKTLRSFHPRVTAVQQVGTVTLRSYDPKTKQVFASTKTSPQQIAEIGLKRDEVKGKFGTDSVHIATAAVESQGEGDKLAQALLDTIANSYIAAEGVAPGDPKLHAGAIVDVKGVGKKFSGKYRITHSLHTLRGGGAYEVVFSSFPVASIAEPNGNGHSPDFAGALVVAKVTNNKDPDKLGRVKISYFHLDEAVEGNWARIAVPSAGKERGLSMLPVVGEEVLVGFESNDTTRPVIVGSMNNGKDLPGTELAAEDGSYALRSDEKIIQRSKKETIISSDDKMEVTIKGEVKEVFGDKHSNEVTKDAEFKVGGGYKLEVTGSLEVKGGPSIKVESTGTMELKSQQIALKATQLDLEGSAMVNIKGGLINIG